MVVLLRNMDTAHGLCNGTRLIIESASNFRISAHIINEGPHQGLRVTLSRIMHTTNPDQHLPFLLKRTQFPIALAYAMTIHKAEGQTIKKAGVLLSEPVFSHGQLFVALSRVGNPADIKILVRNVPNQHFVTAVAARLATLPPLPDPSLEIPPYHPDRQLTRAHIAIPQNQELRQDASYPHQSNIQDEPQYASYEITSHRSSRIAQARYFFA
eukprot:g57948.t1